MFECVEGGAGGDVHEDVVAGSGGRGLDERVSRVEFSECVEECGGFGEDGECSLWEFPAGGLALVVDFHVAGHCKRGVGLCRLWFMVKFRPVGGRLLVKQEAAKEAEGAIVLPTQMQVPPRVGLVCAVGPGEVISSGERVGVCAAVGDRVLFAAYAGTRVKVEGEEYLVLSEQDVLGVVEAGAEVESVA